MNLLYKLGLLWELLFEVWVLEDKADYSIVGSLEKLMLLMDLGVSVFCMWIAGRVFK
jgi:hypothetical protein